MQVQLFIHLLRQINKSKSKITLMKHLNLSAIFASLILLSSTSCMKVVTAFANSQCEAKGPVITQKRPMQPVSALSTSSGISVEYVQADTLSLIVEAPDDIIDLVTTKIDGSELNIGTTRSLNNCASLVKVRVSAPMITAFTSSSGGALSMGAGLSATGKPVSATASSGSAISIPAITAESISTVCSSGASIDIDGIDTGSLCADASSGSQISLSGNATSVTFHASSGAGVSAGGLKAVTGTSGASSGGSITSNVTGSYSVKESSGGSVSNR